MLPAPLCLSACGSEHVTRTLVRACQGLRLSNHWSGSITTYKLSTVLSRRRDRDAIRNACSLVCHTHAGTLKHTTSPTTHMSARTRTSVEIVRRRCRLDARAVASRAVSSLACCAQMWISTSDCSRLVVFTWSVERRRSTWPEPWTLGACLRALPRATTSQPRRPMAIATLGRVVRPSRIDRTLPTTSHEGHRRVPHPFRG